MAKTQKRHQRTRKGKKYWAGKGTSSCDKKGVGKQLQMVFREKESKKKKETPEEEMDKWDKYYEQGYMSAHEANLHRQRDKG